MPAGADRPLTVDTSVAVALLVRQHPARAGLLDWVADRDLSLCGHAWLETYAVLTRLPGAARIAPRDAAALMDANFVTPLSPKPSTLARAVERFVDAGIAGGATYDGWVALTALDHQARLVSRDARAELTYRRLGVDLEMLA